MHKIKIAQLLGKAIRIVNKKMYYDFLLRIFSTPPKAKNKPSLFPTTFDISTVHLQDDIKSQTFAMYQKLDSGTVIVFAHGWGGSFQNFTHFIQPALDRNISIIGFDAPAHGISEEKTTHLLAFKEAVKHCLNEVRTFDNIIVVGHSLGAAAAVLAIMACPEIKVQHLFALGAPADLRKIFDDYINLMNVSDKDAQKVAGYIKQKIQLDFDADNWRKKQIPDHLAQLTLLHGKNDDVVKAEAILSLAQDWQLDDEKDVRLLGHVSHYNILKSTEAIQHVLSQIE